MKIKLEHGFVIFKFDGRLDAIEVEKNRDFILRNISRVEKVIFDLSEVNYISSQFINLCLKVAIKVGIDNFLIANASFKSMQIFAAIGLEKIFKFSRGLSLFA